MFELVYIDTEFFRVKSLVSRKIAPAKFISKVKPYTSKINFYNLFDNNWIKKGFHGLIRVNCKNNYIPYLDLIHLYGKQKDESYIQKGLYVGSLIKSIPIALVTNISLISKIPSHILLAHLASWTRLKVSVLKKQVSHTLKLIVSHNNPTEKEVLANVF